MKKSMHRGTYSSDKSECLLTRLSWIFSLPQVVFYLTPFFLLPFSALHIKQIIHTTKHTLAKFTKRKQINNLLILLNRTTNNIRTQLRPDNFAGDTTCLQLKTEYCNFFEAKKKRNSIIFWNNCYTFGGILIADDKNLFGLVCEKRR